MDDVHSYLIGAHAMSSLTPLKTDKTGAKTAIFTDNDGVEHSVVARRDGERYFIQYRLTIDGVSDGPVIEKRGTGRNLTWRLDGGGSYGGTLQDAVERAVRQHLDHLRYVAEQNTTVDRIKAVLPYEFTDEQQAIDFAFSNVPTAIGVVGKYRGKFYVGFYASDIVDYQLQVLSDIQYLDIRVYGRIDPRKVISRLRDLGISATLDRDYTSAQIYIDNGNGALLLDKETGNLEIVHWDRTGGVASDQHRGAGYGRQQRRRGHPPLVRVVRPPAARTEPPGAPPDRGARWRRALRRGAGQGSAPHAGARGARCRLHLRSRLQRGAGLTPAHLSPSPHLPRGLGLSHV